jgi:hypothetical protein
MGWQDRFIASCTCWNEFWERTKKLSTDGKKGAAHLNPHSPDNALSFGAACAIQI